MMSLAQITISYYIFVFVIYPLVFLIQIFNIVYTIIFGFMSVLYFCICENSNTISNLDI